MAHKTRKIRWIATFASREDANDWILSRGGVILKRNKLTGKNGLMPEYNPGNRNWDVWLIERY